MSRAKVLTRSELSKMNIKERAEWAGVKPRYMSMGYWTPRSERKYGKGKAKRR